MGVGQAAGKGRWASVVAETAGSLAERAVLDCGGLLPPLPIRTRSARPREDPDPRPDRSAR